MAAVGVGREAVSMEKKRLLEGGGEEGSEIYRGNTQTGGCKFIAVVEVEQKASTIFVGKGNGAGGGKYGGQMDRNWPSGLGTTWKDRSSREKLERRSRSIVSKKEIELKQFLTNQQQENCRLWVQGAILQHMD